MNEWRDLAAHYAEKSGNRQRVLDLRYTLALDIGGCAKCGKQIALQLPPIFILIFVYLDIPNFSTYTSSW